MVFKEFLHLWSVFEALDRGKLDRGRNSAKSFALEHVHGLDASLHLRCYNHEANSPTTSSEPFGTSVGDDCSFWIELSNAGVALSSEAGLAVDLITENDQAMGSGDVNDLLQLLTAEGCTGRIVRGVEEQINVLTRQLFKQLFKLREVNLEQTVLGVRWNVEMLVLGEL